MKTVTFAALSNLLLVMVGCSNSNPVEAQSGSYGGTSNNTSSSLSMSTSSHGDADAGTFAASVGGSATGRGSEGTQTSTGSVPSTTSTTETGSGVGTETGTEAGTETETSAPTCGDAIVQPGIEECDDGNDNNYDGCTTTCHLAACGDTYQQPGEECDDGNTIANDGCSDTCANEPFCYTYNNQVHCPTGAVQWCSVAPADCQNADDALAACNACFGGDCASSTTACGDSIAAAPTATPCPSLYSFVYESGTCASGSVHYECLGGGSFGRWCE